MSNTTQIRCKVSLARIGKAGAIAEVSDDVLKSLDKADYEIVKAKETKPEPAAPKAETKPAPKKDK